MKKPITLKKRRVVFMVSSVARVKEKVVDG